MDKYILKSYAVGYEVPFLSLDDPTGQRELAERITSEYRDWFDVIDISLKQCKLPNTNSLLVFQILVRVDTDSLQSSKLEEDWNLMISSVESSIEEFLTNRNLIYERRSYEL